MHADDTVVYASGNTSTSVADKLNANLDKISSWLYSSCLTFNKKNQFAFPLKNSGNLGIIIDYQLNFKRHIKPICKTIKAHLGCFMMIRNCLSFDCDFIL